MIHTFHALMLIGLSFMTTSSYATQLSDPFIKLSSVAPDIIQSPHYATTQNFLGKQVPGYHSSELYCTREAALALKEVNVALNEKGYALVVYDAYRPQRAVNAFIDWSKDETDLVGQAHYYPTLPKSSLFTLGYLAEKSSHSRGSTFDLTLLPLRQNLKPMTFTVRTLQNGETIPFLDDNTVDMGSSFDLFHPVSNHNSPLITPEQAHMRNLLRHEMKQHRFKELKEEWWHYTLAQEPYPETYFDVVYK